MSLSKEEVTAPAASEEDEPAPRRPKCTRCRHHGIIVLLKGHRKWCPFLTCDCWKCYLITQRTQISSLQRSLKRGQSSQSRPGDRGRSPTSGSPSAAAAPAPAPAPGPPPQPDGGARPSPPSPPPLPTSGLTSPRRSADRAPGGGGPFTSGEEGGPCSALNARYLGDGGLTAPQPVIYYTDHFPSSFGLWPKVFYNVQQLPLHPPPPPGFYNGPRPVFASFQQGAANFPPPPPEPGPPADCRRVFFTLQPPPPLTDAPQEEVMSRLQPQS